MKINGNNLIIDEYIKRFENDLNSNKEYFKFNLTNTKFVIDVKYNDGGSCSTNPCPELCKRHE